MLIGLNGKNDSFVMVNNTRGIPKAIEPLVNNILVDGFVGSGKTSLCIEPTILNTDKSLLYVGVYADELYYGTEKCLNNKGIDSVLLDFAQGDFHINVIDLMEIYVGVDPCSNGDCLIGEFADIFIKHYESYIKSDDRTYIKGLFLKYLDNVFKILYFSGNKKEASQALASILDKIPNDSLRSCLQRDLGLLMSKNHSEVEFSKNMFLNKKFAIFIKPPVFINSDNDKFAKLMSELTFVTMVYISKTLDKTGMLYILDECQDLGYFSKELLRYKSLDCSIYTFQDFNNQAAGLRLREQINLDSFFQVNVEYPSDRSGVIVEYDLSGADLEKTGDVT